jgi:hypothetical protein
MNVPRQAKIYFNFPSRTQDGNKNTTQSASVAVDVMVERNPVIDIATPGNRQNP